MSSPSPATPPSRGLRTDEAAQRLREIGENALPRTEPPSLARRVVRQLASPLVYLLLFALAFDVALWLWHGGEGVPIEALAIGAVLALNAGLGALQEHRSEAALAQLQAMASPQVWVLRDGMLARVPGRELVPGDVVRVEAGERVAADGTLVEAQGLAVDESVLTGESVPLDKAEGSEVSSGTLAVRGKGLFEVTRTGTASTMGRLAAMLGGLTAEPTPLERRLHAFGDRIAKLIFGLALVLAIGGVLGEGVGRLGEVVLFAVALAVAAVPEGMPAVVTLTLALGVQRMAKRNAVVRRLAAVEALGSVTVIATDKTGTLTENRMRVRAVEVERDGRVERVAAREATWTASGAIRDALVAMVLANDADHATVGGAERVGDPLEVGLLLFASEAGADVGGLRAAYPRLGGRPFDSAWKFQRVEVQEEGRVRSYVKGAPEVILARAALDEAARAAWSARADAAAEEGHRVLALARSEGSDEDTLTLLGLVLLWDPPRREVPAAIATAKQAGVRVVMITGDHPATARAIARSIGIDAEDVLTGDELDALRGEADPKEALRRVVERVSVYARVSPEHKLAIVEALKASGQIVAMTGDGVNDAPALKRADVGVAMGLRGSDVAREVSDLVLLDDDFATIVGAIEEGRAIYENILSFIRFTFSTNVALVLLIVSGAVGAYVLGLRTSEGALLVPLTALQLLWINFLGDGPPALALALDRVPDVMRRGPRAPSSPLLDRASLTFILGAGVLRGLISVGLLVVLPALGLGLGAVQTVLFLHEATTKLLGAYPARRIERAPRGNPALHAAVAIGVLLQVAALAVPPFRSLLALSPLAAHEVGLLVVAIAITWASIELAAQVVRRTATRG